MKSLWVMIGVSLLTVILCTMCTFYIVKTCDEYIAVNQETQQAAVREDFESAEKILNSMLEKWESTERILEMVCDHDDLNLVTVSLGRAKIYCEQRDAYKLEIECTHIEAAFINIAHKEKMNVENII